MCQAIQTNRVQEAPNVHLSEVLLKVRFGDTDNHHAHTLIRGYMHSGNPQNVWWLSNLDLPQTSLR